MGGAAAAAVAALFNAVAFPGRIDRSATSPRRPAATKPRSGRCTCMRRSLGSSNCGDASRQLGGPQRSEAFTLLQPITSTG
ncbi:hypothetical protein [Paraburkholderia phenoliruptrix]|uniref:hypothetical protein n=1 Tax=Paraburkholderia phenoliruptrix TaxID=252970 RepID=UPI0011D1A17F